MKEIYKRLIKDGILKKHNIKAYIKVVEMFKIKNKVAIDHATGTGKSFISLQLMYDNQDKKILFLVPREGIGSQIEEHINGLSPDAREKHFKNVKIMTIQSFIKLTREELKNLDVDLLITDEFHHYGSEVWGPKVKEFINYHPNLKVFGMTATPKRERGSSREEDMGESFFEGNIASRYSLADAIAEGVLQAPIYRGAIYKLGVQIDESINKVETSNLSVEKKRELLEKLKSARKRVQEAYSFSDILKKHVKRNGKYIVFCPPKNEEMEKVIESSYSWFKDFIDECEITRYQVRSNYSRRVNKINSDAFYNDKDENKLKLMFAMDMYNEGIHVPDIDGVIMLRPTQSDIIFYQQLGRALAAGGEEKRPLVLDFVNNYDYIRKLELKVNQVRNSLKKERNLTGDFFNDYDLNIAFDIDIQNIDIQNLLFEVNSKVFLSFEKKIEEYIEMLNQGYIPKVFEKEQTFSNGQSINYFWNDNKNKIKEELYGADKYQEGYETAKKIVSSLNFDKIAEYIEMLNQGYIPRWLDRQTKFSSNQPINYFWSVKENREQIIKRLFTEEKYQKGYEKAKGLISQIITKKENEFSIEQKIEEYIEFLNGGYIPKVCDKEVKFSNGQLINYFWSDHKEKIKEQLFTKKYIEGYNKAKEILNNLEFDKIADFIELLNQGYLPKKVDKVRTFSNGQLINQFWSTRDNKYKIKERLFTEEKYQVGYDIAKKIVAEKLGIILEDLELDNKVDIITLENNQLKK